MGPDDNIKKTARTRDNFSMYDQKKYYNDNCNGFHRRRVQCRYVHMFLLQYIYCKSCDAYTRRIIVFILPCAAYSAVGDPLCLVVGAYTSY